MRDQVHKKLPGKCFKFREPQTKILKIVKTNLSETISLNGFFTKCKSDHSEYLEKIERSNRNHIVNNQKNISHRLFT